jgi:hypothetical protein
MGAPVAGRIRAKVLDQILNRAGSYIQAEAGKEQAATS